MNGRKIIIYIIIAVVLVAAAVIIRFTVSDKGEEMYSMTKSEGVARGWVENHAPTYLFDGSGLELSDAKDIECEYCYEFTFGFESAYAGYGDRSNELTAELITPHLIMVTVEKGTVTKAVTDGVFDEAAGEYIKFIDFGKVELPNAAATFCEDYEGVYEIRTLEDGSKQGICTVNKVECDAWKFYTSECIPPGMDVKG